MAGPRLYLDVPGFQGSTSLAVVIAQGIEAFHISFGSKAKDARSRDATVAHGGLGMMGVDAFPVYITAEGSRWHPNDLGQVAHQGALVYLRAFTVGYREKRKELYKHVAPPVMIAVAASQVHTGSDLYIGHPHKAGRVCG